MNLLQKWKLSRTMFKQMELNMKAEMEKQLRLNHLLTTDNFAEVIRELLEQVNGLQSEVIITFANGNKMEVRPIKKQQEGISLAERANPWS